MDMMMKPVVWDTRYAGLMFVMWWGHDDRNDAAQRGSNDFALRRCRPLVALDVGFSGGKICPETSVMGPTCAIVHSKPEIPERVDLSRSSEVTRGWKLAVWGAYWDDVIAAGNGRRPAYALRLAHSSAG
ncbi:hypothetical protein EH240_35545 [Mesorhizobium tamadayense]|uniref:Uncharacterized protein n=1 Tax=Mesorhizobium tamadayense TaxID=425306 RepID=A0A3P3EP68_9HYPH|nr:hypothetical protein [Mesorhizobium tamadayense]RRH88200.1 hypothetical protein EH240_35545 [Mesorhizobium tamadayense]